MSTTRPPDIYRALIESTAFGTREIIEAFEARGIKVKELVAAGGLPKKKLLYDYFGRGANDAMKRLKARKREVKTKPPCM